MLSDIKNLIKFFQVLSVLISCGAKTLWSPRQARLSSAEPTNNYYYRNVDGHPNTYSYGYDVSDPATGNTQYRTEERYPNGTVVGSYGYVDPMGKARRFRYIADERGYRVMRDHPSYKPPFTDYRHPPYTGLFGITTEPSVTWTRPSKKKYNKSQQSIKSNIQNYINQPYFSYI